MSAHGPVFPPPPPGTLTQPVPNALYGNSKVQAKDMHCLQSHSLWRTRATGKCSVCGDWSRTVLSQSLLITVLLAASSFPFSKWPQVHLSDQECRLYASSVYCLYMCKAHSSCFSAKNQNQLIILCHEGMPAHWSCKVRHERPVYLCIVCIYTYMYIHTIYT